jgi:hypothetical protein
VSRLRIRLELDDDDETFRGDADASLTYGADLKDVPDDELDLIIRTDKAAMRAAFDRAWERIVTQSSGVALTPAEAMVADPDTFGTPGLEH